VPDALEQYERLIGLEASEVFVDRGYKGITQYKTTKIQIPKPQKNITKSKRKKHSKRAAIEPIIGHLKTDYRLGRNFLKGIIGDHINIILAAAAMNFKRAMNLWRTEAIARWKLILQMLLDVYTIFMPKKTIRTF
jgi:transposase, IS5 family